MVRVREQHDGALLQDLGRDAEDGAGVRRVLLEPGPPQFLVAQVVPEGEEVAAVGPRGDVGRVGFGPGRGRVRRGGDCSTSALHAPAA